MHEFLSFAAEHQFLVIIMECIAVVPAISFADALARLLAVLVAGRKQ